jgi:hypothetical protein
VSCPAYSAPVNSAVTYVVRHSGLHSAGRGDLQAVPSRQRCSTVDGQRTVITTESSTAVHECPVPGPHIT